MTGIEAILIALGVLAGIVVAVFLLVYLLVPIFKALGWIIRQVFVFIAGELTDVARAIGAILTSLVLVPLIVGTVIIGRWSATAHYGRAFQSEIGTIAACLYRMVIAHPLRLVGLGAVTEGIERRLPEVVAAAPGADRPRGKHGQFEGYTIVGSLPTGGSGARLYVAAPDAMKAAAFARQGVKGVDQVVIKSFSLQDGSTLPQIVRESRSLDAAKNMGLILDHHLAQDRFHYVMRYVPGESLTLVTRRLHAAAPSNGLGAPEIRTALGYAADVLSTLATYHAGGLWHKDVKPDNIIVDAGTGVATLVDFGLLSHLSSAMTLTTHGTEYFRDPELVRLALRGVKVHEVDGTRFDLFAAGAVLYSLVEDSFPAHGVLSQVSKRCPEAVKWIIRRAMTDYDKRYASADHMLADVRAVLAASDPFALRPVDLPSMSGVAPQPFVAHDAPDAPAHPRHAPEPSVSPIPVMPPPIPAQAGARPRAPRIKVTNWWTGQSYLEPVVGTPSPASPGDWGQAAKAWSAHTPPRAAPVPRGVPGRPAHEQLKAAADRVNATRERVRTRFARTGKQPYASGINVGVVGALAIAGAIIVALVVRSSVNTPAPIVPVPTAEIPGGWQRIAAGFEAAARELHQHVESGATDTGANGVRTNRASVSVRVSGQPTAEAITTPRVSPLPSPSEPAPKVEGRVALVSDLLDPISDVAAARVRTLLAAFEQLGVEVRGSAPGLKADEQAEAESVELLAQARLAMGQATPDSPEARTRMGEWLASRPGADVMVWLLPPAAGSDEPRLMIYSPEPLPDEAERIRIAGLLKALAQATTPRRASGR